MYLMAGAVFNGQDLHLDGACGVDPLSRELVFQRHCCANLPFPSKPDRTVEHVRMVTRKVIIRLPGKGNSSPHDAKPVYQIMSMIKWMRTSRSAIKKLLYLDGIAYLAAMMIIEDSLIEKK